MNKIAIEKHLDGLGVTKKTITRLKRGNKHEWAKLLWYISDSSFEEIKKISPFSKDLTCVIQYYGDNYFMVFREPGALFKPTDLAAKKIIIEKKLYKKETTSVPDTYFVVIKKADYRNIAVHKIEKRAAIKTSLQP